MNTELKQAIKILCQELQKDDGYFYSWQANIAVCFQDACRQERINFPQLHKISNDAAICFLKRLINTNS